MSEIVKLRTRADIDEEAAVWIWRMDSAAVAGATGKGTRHGCARIRAIGAPRRPLSTVWNALDGLRGQARPRRLRLSPRPRSCRCCIIHDVGGFAAAAVLAASRSVRLWLQQGGELQTLATAVGQQRNVTLADGSIVTLNTNTIVETDLRRRTREIYLRKGEAHFQVAHAARGHSWYTPAMPWCGPSVPHSKFAC